MAIGNNDNTKQWKEWEGELKKKKKKDAETMSWVRERVKHWKTDRKYSKMKKKEREKISSVNFWIVVGIVFRALIFDGTLFSVDFAQVQSLNNWITVSGNNTIRVLSVLCV